MIGRMNFMKSSENKFGKNIFSEGSARCNHKRKSENMFQNLSDIKIRRSAIFNFDSLFGIM